MDYVFDQAGVELASSAESVWTLIDEDAVEQAVINLLSNALKYGDGKPVTLRCSGVNGHAQVEVIDHGRGVEREAHDRIFERFHREERAISENVPGAGLGLALVRHIVNAHQGSIAVASEPGHGATFTISLPVRES